MRSSCGGPAIMYEINRTISHSQDPEGGGRRGKRGQRCFGGERGLCFVLLSLFLFALPPALADCMLLCVVMQRNAHFALARGPAPDFVHLALYESFSGSTNRCCSSFGKLQGRKQTPGLQRFLMLFGSRVYPGLCSAWLHGEPVPRQTASARKRGRFGPGPSVRASNLCRYFSSKLQIWIDLLRLGESVWVEWASSF